MTLSVVICNGLINNDMAWPSPRLKKYFYHSITVLANLTIPILKVNDY